jgi:hypothetical protein
VRILFTLSFPNSYFSNDSHRGVCIFRRRQTSEHGQRGFRLSSLGILLAPSVRPRPWQHVSALKALANEIYSSLDEHPRGSVSEPQDDDWEPARLFFDERRVRSTDLGGAGDWRQWSEELDPHLGVSLSFPSRARFLEYRGSLFFFSIQTGMHPYTPMPTRRSIFHTSCASLDLHPSHCTSTFSAAAAYLYIRNPLSRLHASSAKSQQTCASRIRLQSSPSKVIPCTRVKGENRRKASMCSVSSRYMISTPSSMSRKLDAVG